MSPVPWTQIISDFKHQRIAVIGDVMLDQYIWGKAERISPEAPVPVVEVLRESVAPGGAGNVAVNIAMLGGNASLYSVCGADEAGRLLLEKCVSSGINVAAVLTDNTRPTTSKTRIVAHDQQITRVDRESKAPVDESISKELIRRLREDIEQLTAVIVSDYDKGSVSSWLLAELSRLSKRVGVALFLDCKSAKFQKGLWLTCITPNEHEISVLSGVHVHDDRSRRLATQKLFQTVDLEYLLVTRSEQGMSLFRKNGTVAHCPAFAREVYDITGAGDTVVASFALAVGAGAGPEDAIVLASAAAAQAVSKLGTSPIWAVELQRAMKCLCRDRKAKAPGSG